MKITQPVLDELRKQAERQAQRNYKAIEIDCRTVLALVAEIERSRAVAERFSCENGLIAKL